MPTPTGVEDVIAELDDLAARLNRLVDASTFEGSGAPLWGEAETIAAYAVSLRSRDPNVAVSQVRAALPKIREHVELRERMHRAPKKESN